MKKDNKIPGIISLIFIGGLFMTYLVFNILGLFKSSGIIPLKELEGHIHKGEYVEAYADEITGPVYTVSHTLNGLIPIGTEYYYEIIDKRTGYAYIVRASKSFDRKADAGSVVSVKGKVRSMDRDYTDYFIKETDGLSACGYRSGYAGEVLYIDNYVFFNSLLGVIGVLFTCVPIALLIITPTARKPVNTFSAFDKVFVAADIIAIFAGLFIIGYTITFLF